MSDRGPGSLSLGPLTSSAAAIADELVASLDDAIIGGSAGAGASNPRGVKRSFDSPQDLADNLIDSVRSFRPADVGVSSILESAMPGEPSAKIRVLSTYAGLSDQGRLTDTTIKQSILAKAFPRDHWEVGFSEYAPLFVARNEPAFSTLTSGSAVFDLPTINYYAEAAALDAAVAALAALAGGRRAALRAAAAAATDMKTYSALTAEEFAGKFNLLGVMSHARDGVAASGLAALPGAFDSRPSGLSAANQRVLDFNCFGRVWAFNTFASRIARGDQVFFVVSEAPTIEGVSFTDPRGNPVIGRSAVGAPDRILQVRGFTDREMAFTPPDSSSTADGNPRDDDADYVHRAARVAREWHDIEWVESTDTFRVRDVAGQEGFREALETVPQLVYDAYMFGTAYKLGMARFTSGNAPTHSDIMAAHRSQAKLVQMPMVELYYGI